MATLFSARSAIAARSSSLSGGAIAGAVVGSVVGALLIILCIFPFVVRTRRGSCRRLVKHGDFTQAELGLSPGGPLPDMGDAVKRLSTDHSVPIPNSVNGSSMGDYQKAASLDHQKPHQPPFISSNVAIHQGLPSPISPPVSPTTSTPNTHAFEAGRTLPCSAPTEATPPSTDPTSISKSRFGSTGRDSTRELSLSDSLGPSPSTRGITSNGITEEPETFEQSSTHRRFSQIPESIRGFIRRQSGHQRRDSRRSTLGGTDGTRSPSLVLEIIPQAHPLAPVFNIDIEARGEAWSYYHPSPGDEPYLPASSAPAPSGSLSIVPPTHNLVTAPLSPISPVYQSSASANAGPFMTARPFVDEPDAISPDSDKTVTPRDPKSFSRQSSLLKKISGGPLHRTDSLPPPTIVSDIPSPPLQLHVGPSGNPMEFMRPTTDSESAWMLKQEIIKMEASPPPDLYPAVAVLPTVDETPFMKPDPGPEPEPEYQSPPDARFELNLNGEEVDDFDMLEFPETNDVMDFSDMSTPPPSSDLSATNTPDTRLTEPYTASPSPRSDFDPKSGQLGTSPRAFACDQCHRVFDQIHKLNHHKRYHDRPHECPHAGCVMRFGTKTHLDRHINDKHNKTKKFYCTQSDCPYSRQGGKSFPRKDNWRRHIMNKHRITPDSDPGPQFVDDTMAGT